MRLWTLMRSRCRKCGVHTRRIHEYYMVHDALWDALIARWKFPLDEHGEAGMLCVGCFEALLGRKLNKHDFIDCPVNDLEQWHGFEKSDRLLDRLTREGEP